METIFDNKSCQIGILASVLIASLFAIGSVQSTYASTETEDTEADMMQKNGMMVDGNMKMMMDNETGMAMMMDTGEGTMTMMNNMTGMMVTMDKEGMIENQTGMMMTMDSSGKPTMEQMSGDTGESENGEDSESENGEDGGFLIIKL